jgi:hypothetical protein
VPPPDEEERGPFLFSPAQVRNAKIMWPDVDLIDEPKPRRGPVEALKAIVRAIVRGWSRN